MCRRRSGEILRVTMLESLLAEEDLRCLSLAGAAVLLVDGAIVSMFMVALRTRSSSRQYGVCI